MLAIEEYFSANYLDSLSTIFYNVIHLNSFRFYFMRRLIVPCKCLLLSLLTTKLPKVPRSDVYLGSLTSTSEATQDRSFKMSTKSRTMSVTLDMPFSFPVSLLLIYKMRIIEFLYLTGQVEDYMSLYYHGNRCPIST